MKRLAVYIVTVILTASTLQARESDTNFYVPDTKTKKSNPSDKSATSKKPEKSETQKKAAVPAQSAKPLRIRQNTPDKPFDPPLDPFGLAQAFHHRWDFSTFLITAEEELRFRLDAARARTLRLARAFSALSTEVESRQQNLNSAALAAYLLSRDQHSWTPIQGRNLTEGQMLAVRATMQQDIKAMQSALTDYETLRNSLNASAEDVALMEKQGLSSAQITSLLTTDRLTVPTSVLAQSNTADVLGERLYSVEALKATLAAENLTDTGDRRRSIASFAPPPPMGRIIRPAAIPSPGLPSEIVMKGQPRGESLKAPEKTAVVFETDINAPVHAVQKGVVVYAGPFRGYGHMIIIEHEKGLFSVYSHLGNIQVRQRQSIDAGTVLGRAGNPPELGRSGMHFQVRKGKAPLKPEEWLGAGEVQKLLTRG